MKFKFKRNDYRGHYLNKPITHIDIDFIDTFDNSVFGNAYYIDAYSNYKLGRILAEGLTDEEFKKITELYERGINMFEANNTEITDAIIK